MSSTQQLLLGEGAGGSAPVFIEDVFSCFLYTGNGSTQTITNGIDLSTKGGMVWQKDRTTGSTDHILCDTARGVNSFLRSDLTSAAGNNGGTDAVYAFNSNGFSTGTVNGTSINLSGDATVSWTFAKAPKFFDVVTYTGNASSRTIAHNLGSVPGCIIVKCTSSVDNWYVYHRSLAATQNVRLNQTAAVATNNFFWDSTAPTSTVFSVGASGNTNQNGDTYVAYLFAHDAGGFGLSGTDNVISCESFTTDGSGNATVSLGYEPQFVMFKSSSNTGDWIMNDTMRGLINNPNVTDQKFLRANTAGAETTGSGIGILSTGFNMAWFASQTFIYIAIRRGPMKVPTLGTTVFEPATRTGTGATATITSSTYPVDMTWIRQTNGSTGYSFMDFDRLRGATKLLYTNNNQNTNNASYTVTGFDVQNGYYLGDDSLGYGVNVSSQPIVYYNFKRAPSFFDEVCYTGTGGSLTLTHNLGVVPELAICKSRSNTDNWEVAVVDPSNPSQFFVGQSSGAQFAINLTDGWGTSPFITADYLTATTFKAGTWWDKGVSARTYVAYLFATCAGVSKVGSYTGNGSTQTINCGFGAGGARFVLIKRTDATGDWYVYDTARGMTVLTDPYLLLNSANAQVATLGSVTTVSTGFALDSTILAAINVSAGTYIFLAIA